MQNEELIKAQIQIEESSHKFSDLYDFAPVGYFTVDKKGIIVEANLTFYSMLGYERSVLLKQPMSNFTVRVDQDIYYLHRNHVFEDGEHDEHRECELRMVENMAS